MLGDLENRRLVMVSVYFGDFVSKPGDLYTLLSDSLVCGMTLWG